MKIKLLKLLAFLVPMLLAGQSIANSQYELRIPVEKMKFSYGWSYSDWGVCSSEGEQTRTADCERSDGSLVTGSYCSESPVLTQSCTPPQTYYYSGSGFWDNGSYYQHSCRVDGSGALTSAYNCPTTTNYCADPNRASGTYGC